MKPLFMYETYVVLMVNRVDSTANKIVRRDEVKNFLRENNPIINPDGTEYGEWEVQTDPVSLAEACDYVDKLLKTV